MKRKQSWPFGLWVVTPYKPHKTLAEECLDEIEAQRQDAVERRAGVHDSTRDQELGLEGQPSPP